MKMIIWTGLVLFFVSYLALAAEHPGKVYIEKNGYKGPETCEQCHAGAVHKFMDTVHWKHSSKIDNVENLDPSQEYGMKNRVYTMCNGNDLVNDVKESPKNSVGKTKISGCNTCHMGDHINNVGSVGPAAEASVDCLLCHSSAYDYSKRKATKDEQGHIVMTQDRSTTAALAIGKPGIKNCMICHESAGGGLYFKRGFSFTAQTDVHASKGMTCVDCHAGKDHKIPTGFDPNNWANDGVRVGCVDCHTDKPHSDPDLDRHTARIACQTCHITKTGGVYAKDFTKWTQKPDKFFEPTTLSKEPEPSGTLPVYTWYNKSVKNIPEYIGPNGRREDLTSKIYPFKYFQGKGFFDKLTGKLLAMDFAPVVASGDALAGVASAAKTLGIASYEPVAGWQTLYFGSNHMVQKKEAALHCQQCHARNGLINFRQLGYTKEEAHKLTQAEIYFEWMAKKQAEEEW